MNTVPNGIYFLYPFGSDWDAVKIEGGHIVDGTEACLAETHNAAGDRWAGVVPSDDDEPLNQTDARQVVLAYYHDESMVSEVSVFRRKQ